MKKLAVIAAVVSVLALAAFAYGEMGGRGKGAGMMSGCGMDGQMMGADQHMSKYLMGLDLDEQQKAFMREIKSRLKKETIRKTADIRIAQIELRELLSQDPVDMKTVEAKVKQLETMRTEMQLSHIKGMEECKSKLTPEQRKKLNEMIENEPMMEGMGMKHDHKRGMKGKRTGSKRDK